MAENNITNENKTDRPLVYLAGDIMTKGSQLARDYEVFSFRNAGIDADLYSPALNKDINDKASVTEEQNNRLAEKITEEDIRRLWNSDIVAICPEQSAIGTMCELGTLYGWKVLANIMAQRADEISEKLYKDSPDKTDEERSRGFAAAFGVECFIIMRHLLDKKIFAHYFDIRTNHLNEKDWRRSFSINQMLYGMILYATQDHELHSDFKEIIPLIKAAVNGESEQADQTEKENAAK